MSHLITETPCGPYRLPPALAPLSSMAGRSLVLCCRSAPAAAGLVVRTDVFAAWRRYGSGGGVGRGGGEVSAQVTLLSEEPMNEWSEGVGPPTRAVKSRCPGRTDGPGEKRGGHAEGRHLPGMKRYIQGGWVSQEGASRPHHGQGRMEGVSMEEGRQTHRERWGKWSWGLRNDQSGGQEAQAAPRPGWRTKASG